MLVALLVFDLAVAAATTVASAPHVTVCCCVLDSFSTERCSTSRVNKGVSAEFGKRKTKTENPSPLG
jgi:hypothetical protein